MELLITILVTFFAGMGAGLGTGFAGMSAAAGDQSHADHFLGHGTLHGSRNRIVIGCACQRSFRLYLWEK